MKVATVHRRFVFVGRGGCVVKEARLAQSVERKTLNLVVVGSSPTVGDPIFVVFV